MDIHVNLLTSPEANNNNVEVFKYFSDDCELGLGFSLHGFPGRG